MNAIREAQAEVDTLLTELFGAKQRQAGKQPGTNGHRSGGAESAGASDDELLARARAAKNGAKLSRLWSGDWGDYRSQSEADLALCGILVFWCNGDAARIDRLFRRSGLYRLKWDEKHEAGDRTYGSLTIAKAIEGSDRHYADEDPDLANARSLVDHLDELTAARLKDADIIHSAVLLYLHDRPRYAVLKAVVKRLLGGTQDWEEGVKQEARRQRQQDGHDRGDAVPDGDADPYESWSTSGADGRYSVRGGRFYRSVTKSDLVDVEVPISNFVAKVVEHRIRDDGEEKQSSFVVEGRMPTIGGLRKLPQCEVPSQQWDNPQWIAKSWGPVPGALPGQREYLAHVIRLFSANVPMTTTYTSTGWHETASGLVYLHSGGSVGADGIHVDVAADGLSRYILPAGGGDVGEAMKTSLAFLAVAPPTVSYALWSLVWRAILCQWLACPVMPHFVGPTGVLKSSTLAALMAHFGDFQDKEHLPARWEFTANILERVAFISKDTLLVIDDVNPETTRLARDDLERKFARMAESVGNASGRRRMGSDLRTRREFWPRGLVASTGEYTPLLPQSRLARVFPIQIEPGAVNRERLAAIQRNLAVLPIATRGYIEHLRGDAPTGIRERLLQLRDDASRSLNVGHSRVPENVAHLYLGLEWGLAFAHKVGALGQSDADDHLKMGWDALVSAAREHSRAIDEGKPTTTFLSVIKELLASGKGWLGARESGKLASGTDGSSSTKLGWVDKDGIYLLPGVAFEAVSEALRHRGGINVGEVALRKALLEDKLLIRAGSSEDSHLTHVKRCENASQRVLWLRRDAIGDLSGACGRATHCFDCGESLSSETDKKCSVCGWFKCRRCGACKCTRRRRA